MIQQIYQVYKAQRFQVMLNWLSISLFILFLIGWSVYGTGFRLEAVFLGIGNIAQFIFYDLIPPRFSSAPNYIKPVLDTLYMSYLGLLITVVGSISIAVMSAKNTMIHPFISIICRGITSFIRAVPALVLGVFVVATFGIGTFSGMLAIGLAGVGILGKAYTETLEEIDGGQLEALRATGANWFQLMLQGVWPQWKPSFVAWTFYKFDTNIRDASVIGLIGGGGIGLVLQSSVKLFNYKEAAFAILVIFALILITEFVTSKIREQIL